jgi:hypothetical protein
MVNAAEIEELRIERAVKNRTSQEEGLAPAGTHSRNSAGKPLFLTCSIFSGFAPLRETNPETL